MCEGGTSMEMKIAQKQTERTEGEGEEMPNDKIRMSKECAMSNDSKKKQVRSDSQSHPFHHEDGVQHILADDRLESGSTSEIVSSFWSHSGNFTALTR